MSLLSLFVIWYDSTMEKELEKKIEDALEMALDTMITEGDHHRVWGLDQIVRILAGDRYEQVKEDLKKETNFEWDTGIAP